MRSHSENRRGSTAAQLQRWTGSDSLSNKRTPIIILCWLKKKPLLKVKCIQGSTHHCIGPYDSPSQPRRPLFPSNCPSFLPGLEPSFQAQIKQLSIHAADNTRTAVTTCFVTLRAAPDRQTVRGKNPPGFLSQVQECFSATDQPAGRTERTWLPSHTRSSASALYWDSITSLPQCNGCGCTKQTKSKGTSVAH